MGFMQFEIPKEEKWVKRVFFDTPEEVNLKFDELCNNTNFRSIQIVTVVPFGIYVGSGKILISYEENINSKQEEGDKS